ncbi:MAG: glycosyltransferase family 4 protein [Sphingomonadaceae bacterium]|nr:glycosyltransferase family 4 protein [Sphingomonadaceae bacterium]
MLTDIAEGLAARGWSVTAIASRRTYDGDGALLPESETINCVEVHRIGTTGFGRSSLTGRAADYLSFYRAARHAARRHVRPGDIAVVKTDPPLLSVATGGTLRRKGARLVHWLQDIYPETATALGIRLPFVSLLKKRRNRSLETAGHIVAISEGMKSRLIAQGIDPDSITVLPNFADEEAIRPLPRLENPLRSEWGFGEDDFVIGYSGNLGRAHDIDTMLGAAEQLRDDERFKFLFVGGGYLRTRLDEEARRRELTNIVTRPYQPRSELNQSLALPDIHWISLRPELEGLIMPSKLYGVAAAGRPVIMVGDPEGDIGRIIRGHEFGLTVVPGDAKGFAETVRRFAGAPAEAKRFGSNARAYIENHAPRRTILCGWDELLKRIA